MTLQDMRNIWSQNRRLFIDLPYLPLYLTERQIRITGDCWCGGRVRILAFKRTPQRDEDKAQVYVGVRKWKKKGPGKTEPYWITVQTEHIVHI
jgi:hypothetical protein